MFVSAMRFGVTLVTYTRRNLSVLVLTCATASVLGAVACGDDDDAAPSTSNGEQKQKVDQVMSIEEACKRVDNALSARKDSADCSSTSVTLPLCPDLVLSDDANTLGCDGLDEATVTACVSALSTVACDKLSTAVSTACELVYSKDGYVCELATKGNHWSVEQWFWGGKSGCA